jgi:hypothetical protein
MLAEEEAGGALVVVAVGLLGISGMPGWYSAYCWSGW